MLRIKCPLIVAHRGASCIAPENTLAAFRLGIEAVADGVEFDVRLASDGVPVVIHDRDLRRLAGRSETIAALTAGELAGVDLGSHFNQQHPKRARAEFSGAGVPTLAAVLELFAGRRGPTHIELKIDKKRELQPLLAAVCDLIRDSPALPDIVISSFRLTAIAEAKRLMPGVRTSALFAPSIMRFIKRRRHMIALARAFGADEISPNRSLVTRKFASIAADAGMPVNIWTCDSAKWVARDRKFGIQAVMTNSPERLILARDREVE